MRSEIYDRLLSTSGLLALLVVVFVVGRTFAFFSYDDVVVWPDSEDYASIANYPTGSGNLWMAHRPPVYPYIIKSFKDRSPVEGDQSPILRGFLGYSPKIAVGKGLDGEPDFINNIANVNVTALAITQFSLSVFAWCVFALVSTRTLPGAGLRLTGIAVILLIGLDQNITLWDRHILTESFSTTLFLLLVSATLTYIRTEQREILILACMVALIYGGIKGTNPYILLAFSLLMFGTPFIRQTNWRAGFAICGAVFLAIAALNIYSAGKGFRGVIPLQNVLNSRIIAAGYEDIYGSFRASGMPDVPESFYQQNWHAPFDSQPELHHWLITSGPGTYKKYLVSHPAYLFVRPFTTPVSKYNLPVYTYYDSYLALYGQPNALGTTIFFGKYSFAVFFVCGIVALGSAGRKLQPRRNFEPVFFAYLFLTGILLSILVWHGDLIENSRHMSQVTVQLRLAAALITLYCFGLIYTRRRARPDLPTNRH